MRGCRYTAPPLTSTVFVVDRSSQLHYITLNLFAEAPFHNIIGAFRRKADYKNDFYSFFRNDIQIYADAAETLQEIKSRNILIGTLSDVAYGMDNSYALEDIKPLLEYIDIPLTSNDVGYRKPNGKGLEILSNKMNVLTSEMIFVGDEKKDMECAINAGTIAILINRSDEEKEYGQNYDIKELKELVTIGHL